MDLLACEHCVYRLADTGNLYELPIVNDAPAPESQPASEEGFVVSYRCSPGDAWF